MRREHIVKWMTFLSKGPLLKCSFADKLAMCIRTSIGTEEMIHLLNSWNLLVVARESISIQD